MRRSLLHLARCAARGVAAPPPAAGGPAAARALHLPGAQREEAEVAGTRFSLETGRLARLADGAVVCTSGGTSVLVTVVSSTQVDADADFLPLQVDYRERAAAGGRIPATFTRREGSPKDREILAARVVDRALRPLFPPGFFNETQLVVTVLSADGCIEPDVVALNAASAALACSPVPWGGPVGCVRLARLGGVNVINPGPVEAEAAELSILYAGSRERTLMVEASASGDGVSDAVFEMALREAHAAAAALVEPQLRLARRAGAPKRAPPPPPAPPALLAAMAAAIEAPLAALFRDGAAMGKAERAHAMGDLKDAGAAAAAAAGAAGGRAAVEASFDELCSRLLRELAWAEGRRCDGRGLEGLRAIGAVAGVLPHVHGSSLFERGDTQALATATVGGLEEAQRVEGLWAGGGGSKRLMLHYGFPPFSVNETGKVNAPSRREIGHGALAEKALAGSLPPASAFPFAVRLNSETLASNGSSSMAAVCAGSMALMDAGVPLGRHVAGISVGLLMEELGGGAVGRTALLTDIQGMEDHLGDMDWKLAGTASGITAAQLDVKPAGVPLELLVAALAPARAARALILEQLSAAIAAPPAELRPSAPRFRLLPVPREAMGRIIGPQGSTVKELERRTGCRLSVQDKEGQVAIFAPDAASLEAGLAAVEAAAGGGVKPGVAYAGRVVKLVDFGAFVELQPSGEQGLLHISELRHERTERVEDVLAMDQELPQVQVLARELNGKLKLSLRALIPPPAGAGNRERVQFDRRRVITSDRV